VDDLVLLTSPSCFTDNFTLRAELGEALRLGAELTLTLGPALGAALDKMLGALLGVELGEMLAPGRAFKLDVELEVALGARLWTLLMLEDQLGVALGAALGTLHLFGARLMLWKALTFGPALGAVLGD
jgi:hypothetical protein